MPRSTKGPRGVAAGLPGARAAAAGSPGSSPDSERHRATMAERAAGLRAELDVLQQKLAEQASGRDVVLEASPRARRPAADGAARARASSGRDAGAALRGRRRHVRARASRSTTCGARPRPASTRFMTTKRTPSRPARRPGSTRAATGKRTSWGGTSGTCRGRGRTTMK